MITYDYKIERRISENKKQTFGPNGIPTELPNVVYIEGPNSSGKSTLLNIIALGLFGLKSNKIDPMLLRRMNTLVSSDYQKLAFKVEISSTEGTPILRSRKSDPNSSEIFLEESADGKIFKPITSETFEGKYNLIYDIPNNPTERLYDLVEELREEQLRYGNRFKEFGWFLRGILKEITQGRDTNRLKEIENRLTEVKERNEDLGSELPALEAFLDLLEKHAYVKFYYYYQNECMRLEDARRKIEEKSEELARSERKISRKSKKLRKRISESQGNFIQHYNEATPLISSLLSKKEKQRFEIWKDINLYDTCEDDLKRIQAETIHYLNVFGTQIDRSQTDDSFRDASLLKRIIDALSEFEDSSFTIPKIKVTIRELMSILRQESEKTYALMSRYQNLNSATEQLESLKEDTEKLLNELHEFGETSSEGDALTEAYTGSFYEEQSQLRNLRNELKDAKEKRDEFLRKCLSKNLSKKSLEQSSFKEFIETLPKNDELKPLISLTETQIEAKISALEKEINDKRGERNSLEVYIEQYKAERENLQKQKPHKFEEYRPHLQDLLQKIESTSQRLLDKYNNNIRGLMNKKIKKSEIEADESLKRYFQEVSKYLAHRISFFRHIDTIYQAKAVDLISGVIITEDASTIHLADMGTGQSQSAYLLGLLNVKNDNRKIIALFDEIAMMDDSSLEPIYEKLRELYEAERLLLGILVQKGNRIRIKSLCDG
jgi:exonuclease SbcC